MNFDFKKKTVLVLGDIIKDSYYHGACNRISPEAPVPVVKIAEGTFRLGGAGNVAKNIRRFGIETCLLTLAGDDMVCADLKKACLEENIKSFFVKNKARKTPEKIRVLSQNQQLLRLDFEDDTTNSQQKEEQKALYQCFEKLLIKYKYDLIVFSDYRKGTLQNPKNFIKLANKLKIPVLVDPKGKDFSIYKGAYLIKPNLQEFQAIVGPLKNEKDMVKKAVNLAKSLQLKKGVVLTKGAEGMSYIGVDGKYFSLMAPNVKEVYDVTGAGDTVIASLATCLVGDVNLTIKDSLGFAARAAAVAVGKLGTYSPRIEEVLESKISLVNENSNRSRVEDSTKLLPVRDMLNKLEILRKEGKKIVFTNGCFDVLHAGHTVLLKTAKNYGDILVVGLNTDKSVSSLKGKGRPFHKLAERARVLEELRSVDFIVSFHTPTPLDLIKKIKPDVLVKGAEYNLDDIVGTETVKSYGGAVTTVPMVGKLSTSRVLDGSTRSKQ
ncbi:bifunctional heptose 7-phosphate kinase/heptose 1-phosphate adenyltransferase [Betaproteobacteria bacterium]|nr:bifunctional heptose 7-phosphate kinase/heptose 1-phosphate adenyltransferase [Betaproteobacteria bacterium]